MTQKPFASARLAVATRTAAIRPATAKTGLYTKKAPLKPGYYLMRLRVQYADRGVRPLARIP